MNKPNKIWEKKEKKKVSQANNLMNITNEVSILRLLLPQITSSPPTARRSLRSSRHSAFTMILYSILHYISISTSLYFKFVRLINSASQISMTEINLLL